ncbi:hypothetical protein [cf. Phormidesmis sp. LEGE 11477]|uniref:hypothetical protein n=1 Tax=cf. Phormidesmis sp. LEGE 11477 TaxID=1828680 RepID=UPI00187E0449|nr:hypothetical protein [cf. Phormidesmis sp. LEGE 11477]MBE9061947.1 hypothetical protein [cf. Phormidesmis sp. LEGE 11477]
MSPLVESRQRAILLIEQLSQEKLPAVIQLLELLAEPVQKSSTSDEENRLLAIIQRRLPEEQQLRLNDLRHRCEWSQLTESEHAELIKFEDRVEELRVNRLASLIELAKLKDVDLMTLNQEISSSKESSRAA